MKRHLLSTTSLAGAGLLASAGVAQAEMSMGVGGFFHMWTGIVDADVCESGSRGGCNDAHVLQVGEVAFNMSGTLDNGIEIGGVVELETQGDGDYVDAARINIAGPFGAFQLGQEDSARHNWAFDTAAPNEGVLINSGWETAFAMSTQTSAGLLRPNHSTALDFSDKAPKVTYFTPRVNGFQLAATWTPNTQSVAGRDDGEGNFVGGYGADGAVFGPADERDTYTNAVDFGAHYTGEMGGVGVTVQGGYGTVEAPDIVSGSNPEIYQAGVSLSFENFTVAGAWAEVDGGMRFGGVMQDGKLVGGASTEGRSYTFGAGYSMGPWAFAAGYLRGEEEGDPGGGDDTNDIYQVSASYALSDGLGVNVQYLRVERETDGINPDKQDNDADAWLVGVKAGF